MIANTVPPNDHAAATVEDDAVCAVCQDGSSDEKDPILFCDGCNLPVHQKCYQVPNVPDGEWRCVPCEENVNAPKCAYCPNGDGPNAAAMKLVINDTEQCWACVNCITFLPELYNQGDHRTACGRVDPLRCGGRLKCSLCLDQHGATVQCCYGRCPVAFHVTCALYAKLATHKDARKLAFYCERHKGRGMPMEEEGGEEEEEEGVAVAAAREVFELAQVAARAAAPETVAVAAAGEARKASCGGCNYWGIGSVDGRHPSQKHHMEFGGCLATDEPETAAESQVGANAGAELGEVAAVAAEAPKERAAAEAESDAETEEMEVEVVKEEAASAASASEEAAASEAAEEATEEAALDAAEEAAAAGEAASEAAAEEASVDLAASEEEAAEEAAVEEVEEVEVEASVVEPVAAEKPASKPSAEEEVESEAEAEAGASEEEPATAVAERKRASKRKRADGDGDGNGDDDKGDDDEGDDEADGSPVRHCLLNSFRRVVPKVALLALSTAALAAQGSVAGQLAHTSSGSEGEGEGAPLMLPAPPLAPPTESDPSSTWSAVTSAVGTAFFGAVTTWFSKTMRPS